MQRAVESVLRAAVLKRLQGLLITARRLYRLLPTHMSVSGEWIPTRLPAAKYMYFVRSVLLFDGCRKQALLKARMQAAARMLSAVARRATGSSVQRIQLFAEDRHRQAYSGMAFECPQSVVQRAQATAERFDAQRQIFCPLCSVAWVRLCQNLFRSVFFSCDLPPRSLRERAAQLYLRGYNLSHASSIAGP